MLFRDVISLITTTHTTNAIGDSIGDPTSRTVFAEKKSVRRDETYQAMAVGLKLEAVFAVRTIEYQGEKTLSHNGKTYKVERTDDRENETTELICSGLVE